MGSQVIEESYNSMHSGQYATSALQIRLDTNQIIEDIELFLKGFQIQVVRDDASGTFHTVHVPLDKKNPESGALANPRGRQALLSFVRSQFNSQIVQGNCTEDRLDRYLEAVQLDLAENIIINAYDWGLDEHKINFVLDFIMHSIEIFLTRTLENKERESYIPMMKVHEITGKKEEGNQ